MFAVYPRWEADRCGIPIGAWMHLLWKVRSIDVMGVRMTSMTLVRLVYESKCSAASECLVLGGRRKGNEGYISHEGVGFWADSSLDHIHTRTRTRTRTLHTTLQ